jgi:hypothetical protein
MASAGAARRARAALLRRVFWRFGLDKGTSIDFGQATKAAGAGAARVVEGVSAVRATHPVLYLTHARAFATYRCGVHGGARGSSGNGRLWQRLCRALAAVVASGSQAERRERKGSDFCVGNDCGKGPLARVGHLGERDAAPTGLEFLGRGAYVPLFLSPNPHFMLDATVDLEPISSSA